MPLRGGHAFLEALRAGRRKPINELRRVIIILNSQFSIFNSQLDSLDIKRDILPYKDTMYRLALRITLNSQEAEDVVQDVIIKVWRQSQSSTGVQIENMAAYLLRLTRNLSIDRQRMKANQTESLDAMMSGEDGEHLVSTDAAQAERRAFVAERLSLVRKVMQGLPEKQRTAMQLRDFEGKTYKEIAAIMEITEEQVKVNIFRARQAVKQQV